MLSPLQSRHGALLQEGKFLISVPVQQLERPEFKGLLAWRARVEELARVGPPIIISAADQASIRKKYEIERRSVRDSESFAREAAQRKILKIRADGKRFRERAESKHQQIRLRFDRLKKFLQRKIDIGNSRVEENHREVAHCVSEMNRYREIRLSRYLPRLFGVSPKL